MATKQLTKTKKDIIRQVRERWENTILNGETNAAKASECIVAGYQNSLGAFKRYEAIKKPVIHIVQSPLAFGIALAVKRGRITKRYARQICIGAGIDYAPFAAMRRDRMLSWRQTVPSWYEDNPTEFSRTWLRAVDAVYREMEQELAQNPDSSIRRWRRWGRENDLRIDLQVNNFSLFATIARSHLSDALGNEEDTIAIKNGRLNSFLDKILIGRPTTQRVMNTLAEAYRGRISDLRLSVGRDEDAGPAPRFIRHELTAEDAEIATRVLGLSDLEFTWEHEFFHHATAFAAFEESCIILAGRPTFSFDDDNELHSDTGHAVSWADGSGLWFNHGHLLDEFGLNIVRRPATLTTKKILAIENEETRRVAIDKFGWDQFINEADCPVLDRRENAVDNTIELLVGPPRGEESNWRASKKMVLFCRSTGRRYFLNVPRNIENCEEAQNWMAAAGTLDRPSVPYAKNRIRLVGAS